MQIEREESSVRLSIPSEVRLLDEVAEEVKEFVKTKGAERAPGLILVLRELVNNAIEHGNASDASRTVSVSVEEIGPLRFKIEVSDQGEGFDFEPQNLRLSDDPTQERNRGLPLVNVYADELLFSAGGTTATAYVTVRLETEFEIAEEQGIMRISPTGDLSSSVAEKFRALLVELLEGGRTGFRFDMTRVNDIDSVALSIFVVFANMVTKKSGENVLEVVHSNEDIRDMFHLTRLSRLYSVM